MHDKNDRIMEMATLAVEQRISNALLRLVNQSGRKTPQGIEIDFPIPTTLAWTRCTGGLSSTSGSKRPGSW
jgi:hypothetical protein